MLDAPGEGQALMDELHELVMEEALQPVALRPGALHLIRALTAARVPMAIASNSPRSFLDRVLASAGLAELGVSWVTTIAGDEVAQPKPAPDIYLEACLRLDASPPECVALEDSAPGVAAGRAAGMLVIGVPYFADGELPEANLVATSLGDPIVFDSLGLPIQIGELRAPIA
jgi:HAD superfamily hydrolase (TIGR01509 family)